VRSHQTKVDNPQEKSKVTGAHGVNRAAESNLCAEPQLQEGRLDIIHSEGQRGAVVAIVHQAQRGVPDHDIPADERKMFTSCYLSDRAPDDSHPFGTVLGTREGCFLGFCVYKTPNGSTFQGKLP
jgi:hypothetical protein